MQVFNLVLDSREFLVHLIYLKRTQRLICKMHVWENECISKCLRYYFSDCYVTANRITFLTSIPSVHVNPPPLGLSDHTNFRKVRWEGGWVGQPILDGEYKKNRLQMDQKPSTLFCEIRLCSVKGTIHRKFVNE